MDRQVIEGRDSGRHALVLGGSMAGLVAARVLADYFDRVTVVDRDHFPTEPVPRAGAPQGQHIHALLLRGKHVLEGLFPGLQDTLAAAGAPFVDVLQDLAWLTPKGWGVRFPSSMNGYAASRPLLEWAIRRRVAANPRVRFLEGQSVTGLIANAEATRVIGARVRPRTAADGEDAEAEIRADLVVDASGRGSRLPQWLQNLGYPAPEQTVVDSFLGYATRVYRIPSQAQGDWKGVYIQQAPPAYLQGGVILPIEDNRWIVTLGGSGKNYPPTDEAGFLEFARSLRSPILYEAIRDAEPITPVVGTRTTANVVRHYERLARLPDGVVAAGDAACAFNPVYGQGMTAAALGAVVLEQCLRDEQRRGNDDLLGMPRRFQKRLSDSNRAAWLIATAEDLRVPGAEGKRPGLVAELMYRYLEKIVEASTWDPEARLTLNEVIALMKPTSALVHPRLVARAFRGPGHPATIAPDRQDLLVAAMD